jgi:hypothetical protein
VSPAKARGREEKISFGSNQVGYCFPRQPKTGSFDSYLDFIRCAFPAFEKKIEKIVIFH